MINTQSEPPSFFRQVKAPGRVFLLSALATFFTAANGLTCLADPLPVNPLSPQQNLPSALPANAKNGGSDPGALPPAPPLPITPLPSSPLPPAKLPPQAVKDSPEARPTSPLTLGREAFLAGNYPRALEIFSNFEKEQPANLAVHYWLGCLYQELGNLKEAHRHYATCVKLANSINMDSPHLRINLGNMLASWGNLKDAKFDYERAIEVDPLVPEAYLGLSKCLIEEGNLKGALTAVESYAELGGQDQSKLLVRGLALAGLGQLPQAQEALNDFLALPLTGDKAPLYERNLALARQILTQINQIQGLQQP